MTTVMTIMVMMVVFVTAILVTIICYLDGKRGRNQPFLTTDLEISGIPDWRERAETHDGRRGDKRGIS